MRRGEQFHGDQVTDAADIENYTQANFAVSAVAAQGSALEEGLYDVICDVACFIRVAPTATGVTTSNGYPLLANNVVTVYVRANSKIGAITSAAAGTIRYHKVG